MAPNLPKKYPVRTIYIIGTLKIDKPYHVRHSSIRAQCMAETMEEAIILAHQLDPEFYYSHVLIEKHFVKTNADNPQAIECDDIISEESIIPPQTWFEFEYLGNNETKLKPVETPEEFKQIVCIFLG